MAKVRDERLPACSQILTKNTVLSSMFLIEPERGCSRGCAYCVMRRTANAGMRRVPVESVLSAIPETARKVGLVGAAVSDLPEVKELCRKILAAGGSLADVFGPLVGIGPGAGMGLMFICTCVLGTLTGLSGFLIPAVRRVEEEAD